MDLSREFAASEWDLEKLNPTKLMGFLKHGFVLSFYALLKGLSYDDTVAFAIKLAGDTDTNACIAGGMMGALYGREALPKEKV
jgi:ADP-ribosyl-[dinitrogen reductase] hydrolase